MVADEAYVQAVRASELDVGACIRRSQESAHRFLRVCRAFGRYSVRTCKKLKALLVESSCVSARPSLISPLLFRCGKECRGRRESPFFGMAKRHRPLRLSFKKSSMISQQHLDVCPGSCKAGDDLCLVARSPHVPRDSLSAPEYVYRLSCPCLPVQDRHSGSKPDSLPYTLCGLLSGAFSVMLFSRRRMSRYWTRALSTYMLVVLLATIAKDHLPALPLPAELERSEKVLWVTAHRESHGRSMLRWRHALLTDTRDYSRRRIFFLCAYHPQLAPAKATARRSIVSIHR